MRQRFRLFRRGKVFWCQDNETARQESLHTKDRSEARILLQARNDAYRQPALNLQLARVYLQHGDPLMAARTWETVWDEIVNTKRGSTHARWLMAVKDQALDLLRHRKVIETTAEHFLLVLKAGTVSTNVFLRRIHNFALDMNWLPASLIPKRQWPPVHHREKRAITSEEHQRIVQREHNPEWKAFYGLIWHLGGAQTDIATLDASAVDWRQQTIAYSRRKTATPVIIRFGSAAAEILLRLPSSGFLFPRLSQLHEKHRAKLFRKRCDSVGVRGVSLHSYRYAWAERAKVAGYPERFAQEALGHNSKAVHRAYARKAQVILPPLEDYERQQAGNKLLQIDFRPAESVLPALPAVPAATLDCDGNLDHSRRRMDS